jgi:hypothetical protein
MFGSFPDLSGSVSTNISLGICDFTIFYLTWQIDRYLMIYFDSLVTYSTVFSSDSSERSDIALATDNGDICRPMIKIIEVNISLVKAFFNSAIRFHINYNIPLLVFKDTIFW